MTRVRAVAKGTVTIAADGIPADEVEIVAPRDRFVRDGERWVWSFQDLEPTLADDITVHPIPGFLEVSRYGGSGGHASTFLERAGKWGAGHRAYKVRASSTLAPTRAHAYGAEHVQQPRATGPWAEGVPGLGVGEWLEVVPSGRAPLLALSIVPGFRSDERPELFAANARPSRVEILLNEEHRFVATLGDKPVEQLIPVLGYSKPVSKLRITILEARPGTKYQDTSISSVVLYDRLNQKPDMRGAR
ncbi:MAG: NADase-type glycan-binding domain-containing protein [Anaeromyxobacteraceae bacterium]